MSERRFFVNRQGLRPMPPAPVPPDCAHLEELEVEVRLHGEWVRGRLLGSRRTGASREVLVAYSASSDSVRRVEGWFGIADVRAVHSDD